MFSILFCRFRVSINLAVFLCFGLRFFCRLLLYFLDRVLRAGLSFYAGAGDYLWKKCLMVDGKVLQGLGVDLRGVMKILGNNMKNYLLLGRFVECKNLRLVLIWICSFTLRSADLKIFPILPNHCKY